jgi:serine/threonine-protein kinase
VKLCPGCQAACLDTHRHCPACGTDISEIQPGAGDPFVGATFAGKYKLTELIGVGAMGRVYRARHLALDSEVAVKLVNPDVAADAQAAKRFQTEARAASRLRHPNTIQILDFGQADGGALFLVMEYLRGRTLAKILEEEHALNPRRIADLLGQALGALDEAHASGVVHRDFKPENVFVEALRTGKEHVKVLDFGIAKLRGEADANLTSRGAVCGTPEYMSPEQIRGEELDARSDVYAAGVVLYELITGARPFETRGPVIEVLQAHLSETPVPPRQKRPDLTIPRLLEEVCLRAISKEADDRYRSAAELKAALETAVRGLSGEHCRSCGMPLSATARFCSECGTVQRSGAAPVTVATPSGAAPLVLTLPLPLVGRDAVLARLDPLEHEALLIVGAPGNGKTALVDAWRARQASRFRKVAAAGADPSGAARSWYPIRQLVAQLLGIGAHPSVEEIERAAAARPDDRLGIQVLFGLVPPLPLDVRRRECEAAALGILRGGETVLVLEDVDRYDGPSRKLLGRLIQSPATATVLATADHAEAVAVEVEVLRLGPLDPAAIDHLAQAGLPPGVGELAGGVPLSIVEWVRARQEGARDSTVPARLEKLDAESRALLEAAAVSGGDVDAAICGSAAGVHNLPAALATLSAHGWLRGDAGDAIELASPTVRRRLYEAMSDAQRRVLHGAFAIALAARNDDPILIAHHAYATGEPGTAAVVERAGDAARERFDDDAATRWYRAALERGRQALAAGVGDESRQIRVALKLGIVLRYRGDVIQSEHVLRDALELAQLRNDRWAQIQARRALARLASAWHHHESARDHLMAAVQAALGGSDSATLGELYLELAETLATLGDAEGAERELWEGLMLCTGGDGPEADSGPEPMWRMLILLGELARRGGKLELARGTGAHALRHAERVKSSLGRARAHAFLGRVHEELRQPEPAAEARRRAVAELRSLGDRRATAEMLIALAQGNEMDRAAAQSWVREAEALADQLGWIEGVTRSRAALQSLRT